jgi:hypothetical protein
VTEKVREKADPLVGHGMLINLLPSRHDRRGRPRAVVLSAPPMPDQQTFLYVPSEQGEAGVSYGPAYVGDGIVKTGFTVRPGSARTAWVASPW